MRIGDRIAIMKTGRWCKVGADDILRPANDYVRSFIRGGRGPPCSGR